MTQEKFNSKFRREIALCLALTGEELKLDPQSDDEALVIGEQLVYLTPTDDLVVAAPGLGKLPVRTQQFKWAVEYVYHQSSFNRDEPPSSDVVEYGRYNTLWQAILGAENLLHKWRVDNICQGVPEEECEPSAEEIAAAIKEN